MISPESDVNKNFSGKDFNLLKHTWTAQWISHPTESTLDYGVFLFRYSFKLDEKPGKFIVFVSADNRYRLYVNGQSVCFGPSIGDLSNYRYETVDISDKLNAGRNVLAAEVVNFGEHKKVAQQSFQTAFILQGAKSNAVNVDTGFAGWKVVKNEAYSPIVITSEMLNAYYAAGPCDKVEAVKYPWGWNEIDFYDEDWLLPKKALTEFAVGRGFLYGAAWFLVPRTIPFMEETKEMFEKVARTEGIVVNNDFLLGKAPLTIPGNSKVSILLDQTYHTTGFPELMYSQGSNSLIKITYAEALVRDDVENISDGNLSFADVKGNRNEIKGKSIFGYYDIVLPDGGEKRVLKPLSRRTYRFVQFDIETKDEALIIERYFGVYTGYPFKQLAKFEVENTLFKKINEVSWRTLRNSAAESFFDPYYEQLQYIGDTRIEALVSIYVSGDDRLMRKAIKQFDDSRIPEGLTQSRYPANIMQIIPTYSLIWIDMIHDYFMYRDNPDFLYQFFPGIKSVLDWFISKMDDTGLVTHLSWWNFTDWTLDFENGIPPGADDGYSANIALQLVKSLQNASELLEYFDLKYDSNRYLHLSKTIQKAVVDTCFDENKGLIAETPDKKQFSQHTNIWGILTDTFDKKVQPSIMQRILDDKSLIQATIYFRFYLFRALQKTKMGKRYFELLQPWKTMLDNGMTTFGETDINPRSECHAWSASPAFDFLHIIAGIQPGQHSFNTVIIEPNLGDLDKLIVEMPHPKGMIKVSYLKRDDVLNADIILPDGIVGQLNWGNRRIDLIEGKQRLVIKK